jgi:hypothetical protein
MRLVPVPDGHDASRLVLKFALGFTAMGEDILVRLEGAFDSQFSRMKSSRFSTRLSSGDLGGSDMMVILADLS